MKIGLLGAGNLARALALGLGQPVVVHDPNAARAEALALATGGSTAASAPELAAAVDVVVLCHKPAQLGEVADQLDGAATQLISVLGATPLDKLRAAYPKSTVVRVMPNIAMEIGSGYTILCAPADDERELADATTALFSLVGEVVELDEKLLPLAQGTSGGLPAYVAVIVEAYVDALVRHGMPQEIAVAVVAGSIPGSAQLVAARDGDTLGVRRQVTSPGGTTARALAALDEGGLRAAISAAVDASIA
jgi:pyrroline-5-carboxylate reductase